MLRTLQGTTSTSASCGPASMNIQIYSTAGYPQPYLLLVIIVLIVQVISTAVRIGPGFDCVVLLFAN